MSINISLPVNTEIRPPDTDAPVTLDTLDQFLEYIQKRLRAPQCFIREKHPEDTYHELSIIEMSAPCDIMHIEFYNYIRRTEEYLSRVDPSLPNRDIIIEKAKHFVNTLYIVQKLLRLEHDYLTT